MYSDATVCKMGWLKALGFLLFLISAKAKDAKGKEYVKPNIIFIMVDDVGWADFGYNTPGSSAIPTPQIDKLAEQGWERVSYFT